MQQTISSLSDQLKSKTKPHFNCQNARSIQKSQIFLQKVPFLIKIRNFSKKSISEQNDSFHANRPDFQVWNCYHNDFSRTSKIMLIWDHFVGLTRAGNLFKPIWSFWLFKYSVFRQKIQKNEPAVVILKKFLNVLYL